MKRAPFSSYPYRFWLGQLGQLGQTPESFANREFVVSHSHIYTGPRLGRAGPIHFQEVSSRAKCRARALPGPPLPAEIKKVCEG